MKLSEIRVIVTGGASGLGRAFAYELVRAGATVTIGDLSKTGMSTLAEECQELPGRLNPLQLDVTQEVSVRDFVAGAIDSMKRVDVLVNNAGVLLDGVIAAPEAGWIKKLPIAQWRRVIDTNLTGQFLVAREIAAHMLEQQPSSGLIVNISSLYRVGNAGQSAYAASKAGIDAATRSWSLELSPLGIRVAAIAPGVIETPMLDHISNQARSALIDRIPIGHLGSTNDIWLGLRFIIECEYFNARVLEIDGGARL